MCVRVRVHVVPSHTPALFSGVDVQEAEEGCLTEATTPTSSEPTGESQMSTVELDETVAGEVTASREEVSPAGEDTSPAEKIGASEAEGGPAEAEADSAQPRGSSERKEKPEVDSNSQSVDELLADWREDLEAFKQMEKDEL